MMRGRRGMAVAVRHPSGQVLVHEAPLQRGFYGTGWARRPFIRGVVMLWETLVLGMRALAYSASVAADESPATASVDGSTAGATTSSSPTAEERSADAAKEAFGGAIWGTMAVALVIGIGIFFLSPLLLTRLVDPLLPSTALSVLVEGLVRIALFFGYVWLIGRVPEVRRVFAYHGAEHKAINAYEAGEPLVAERVQRYSVAHPRCGTSFLLFVIVLSIFVFGLVGRPALPVRVASRIVLVPVVAAAAYEAIRFSGRRFQNPAVRALLAPGMALQALTTRQPDTEQLEVAIAALSRVLEADGAAARAA
jgi:uncharacterized protein YqhQ